MTNILLLDQSRAIFAQCQGGRCSSASRHWAPRSSSLSHCRNQRCYRTLAVLDPGAHLPQRLLLDLSDPLPSYTKMFPYGFERPRLAIIQPKAHCENFAFALVERRKHFIEEF